MYNKKQVSFLLAILMLLSFLLTSGCGRSESSNSTAGSDIVLAGESGEKKQSNSDKNDTADLEKPISNASVRKASERLLPILAEADTDVMQDGDIKNILLIGQDRRINDPEVRRSDCMIVFSINLKTNKINLLSLMRDMYIPYSNGEQGMINATYYKGDFELLDATIENAFGIHIDGNMELDFFRFRDFYNLIGPIDLELNEVEVNYLNKAETVPWTAEAGVDSSNWNLQVGMNSLDSGQLLSFARTRYVGWGDWERTERQRRIIMATYNKLKGYNINRLSRVAIQCMRYLRTDMTKEEMMGYLYAILSHNITEFGSYRLPLEGTYTQEIREETLNVIIPQLEPNKQAAMEYIYGEDD